MMQINLAEIKPTRLIKPPRIIIYGPQKIGKSTFAAEAPDVLFAAVEQGLDAITAAKHPINSYQDMLELVGALAKQEHSFKTLAIDTADLLEQRIFDDIASQHGAKSIDDEQCKALGYGRGYTQAVNMWLQLTQGLNLLRDAKNMCIILIAHNVIKKFEDPLTESYDKHFLRMHGKSAAVLTDWADCILFADHKVYLAKEKKEFTKNEHKYKGRDGGRVLYTEESPAYIAGNRYGLPKELPFSWQDFINAFGAATVQK